MRPASVDQVESSETPSPFTNDGEIRAFLASIVESSEDSIVGTDLKGTILTWNRGAEHLWGYTADEAIGRHITILFPEDRQQDYLHNLQHVERQERVERFESVRIKKDGTRVNVSVILSQIGDPQRGVVGVSAIYRDITERIRVDSELRNAKEAAEEASRLKSEFLANMSHEIRTPMNGVLGMLDVALSMELSDELRDYLEIAHASATSLLTILNDVLDFAKIEAGRIQLERIPFSVPALIHETLAPLKVPAEARGLDLRFDVSSEMPLALWGDPTRLRQVLTNLVNNAIKFTEHGSVEVRGALKHMDEREALVEFSVKDTGIGLSEAEQAVVFEAFRQADGSITRRFGGTGLGLSISAQLVTLLGGNLSVESERGKGSTFRFTLPLHGPC